MMISVENFCFILLLSLRQIEIPDWWAGRAAHDNADLHSETQSRTSKTVE